MLNFTDEWTMLSGGTEEAVTSAIECSNTDTETWTCEPTTWGIVIYSVIMPLICALGVVGNSLILVVLSKRCLNESAYTYLSVLAAADLCICALLLFSGLARGAFWRRPGWMEYDIFVYLPLGSVLSNVEVMSAVGLAVDRLVLVSSPAKLNRSNFCSKPIARKIMWMSLLLAVMANVPYFFLYTYNRKGLLVNNFTAMFNLINAVNWMQLFVFGLIPAAFLLSANVILIVAVRRTVEQRKLMVRKRRSREVKYLRDQSKLTITLISIVFLFLIGEVPTHLASRRSAVTILYGGRSDRIDKHVMEIFRTVATLLNAVSSSANIAVYCLVNPRFVAILRSLFSGERVIERRGTLVRVCTVRGSLRRVCNGGDGGDLPGGGEEPWRF